MKKRIPQFNCQFEKPTALISRGQVNHTTCDPVRVLKHTQDLQNAGDDDDAYVDERGNQPSFQKGKGYSRLQTDWNSAFWLVRV